MEPDVAKENKLTYKRVTIYPPISEIKKNKNRTELLISRSPSHSIKSINQLDDWLTPKIIETNNSSE